jgi:hypothetical protein
MSKARATFKVAWRLVRAFFVWNWEVLRLWREDRKNLARAAATAVRVFWES